MKAILIQTERLTLKALSKSHLSEDYVDWMNDKKVNMYLESGGDYTIEKLKSFLEEQEKKQILFWAIHIKSNKKHIGNIKIDPINFDLNSGEYGILMGDKNYWGKGYAYEASKAVIDYCFETINLFKITLGVINHNIGAVKLYEKLGFTQVGLKISKKRYDGKISKIIRMEKIRNKLILGTVQLGLDYGINNNKGKPSLEQSFKILKTAYNNDIRLLDTAEAYGNAHEVIGEFHRQHPKTKFGIITKLKANTSFNTENIIDKIRKNCKELHVDKLYGYMFHNYTSFKENNKQYKLLVKVKEIGLIDKIGISLYKNKELEDIVNNYNDINLIQIPFNLLDNEPKRKAILEKAKKRGIEIHTRSVFLQGLFFKKTEKLPQKLSPLAPYLEKIKEIRKRLNLKVEDIALKYVLSKPYIDYVLIGVDNEQQLLSNITTSKQKTAISFKEIDSLEVVEDELLNPVNW